MLTRFFLLFFRTLHTDWLKYRKSLVIWATLAYPLMVVFLVYLFIIGDKRIPENEVFLFARNCTSVFAFFFPFYLVLSVTQLIYIEHRAQGWKLMYAQPAGRGFFYASKLLFLFLLICMAFILKFIFSSIAIQLLELSKTQFKVGDFFIQYNKFLYPEIKIILSSITLIAIQYWMSIGSRNFLLPFGIGTVATILPLAVFIILGIAGLITSPDKLNNFLKYDPFSLPYSFVFDFANMKNNLTVVSLSPPYVFGSFAVGVGILIAGYFTTFRRNIK